MGRKHRALGCLGLCLAIPLLYYSVQIALRSARTARVHVIAHRGGPRYAPENTLAAFRNAIAQGADDLEFDVQMTKDGELVVIHDETVDRTTDGTGAVRDLTLAEIRALDAGNGERVPTFREVLDLARSAGVNVFPEAKSAHLYPGLEEKMLAELEAVDYLEHAVIQSFEADSLVRLRELNPNVRLCALYGLWKLSVSAPPAAAEYVCPMAEMVLLNPYVIRQAHDAGRQVIVWFGAVENPLLFQWMQFFGVDGLMADDPALLAETVRP
jgi:glycerophosphoryl diester phosphodiesterase